MCCDPKHRQRNLNLIFVHHPSKQMTQFHEYWMSQAKVGAEAVNCLCFTLRLFSGFRKRRIVILDPRWCRLKICRKHQARGIRTMRGVPCCDVTPPRGSHETSRDLQARRLPGFKAQAGAKARVNVRDGLAVCCSELVLRLELKSAIESIPLQLLLIIPNKFDHATLPQRFNVWAVVGNIGPALSDEYCEKCKTLLPTIGLWCWRSTRVSTWR